MASLKIQIDNTQPFLRLPGSAEKHADFTNKGGVANPSRARHERCNDCLTIWPLMPTNIRVGSRDDVYNLTCLSVRRNPICSPRTQERLVLGGRNFIAHHDEKNLRTVLRRNAKKTTDIRSVLSGQYQHNVGAIARLFRGPAYYVFDAINFDEIRNRLPKACLNYRPPPCVFARI